MSYCMCKLFITYGLRSCAYCMAFSSGKPFEWNDIKQSHIGQFSTGSWNSIEITTWTLISEVCCCLFELLLLQINVIGFYDVYLQNILLFEDNHVNVFEFTEPCQYFDHWFRLCLFCHCTNANQYLFAGNRWCTAVRIDAIVWIGTQVNVTLFRKRKKKVYEEKKNKFFLYRKLTAPLGLTGANTNKILDDIHLRIRRKSKYHHHLHPLHWNHNKCFRANAAFEYFGDALNATSLVAMATPSFT